VSAIKRERRSIAASSHSARDPGVTIADFSFSPGSITVHVGDTVQWVNNGPSAHTATANNGSFDTGVLQKGQSASVTFHLPGTFAYHCSIHPFMHGTVVVLAGAKTSSSSSSGSSGSSSASGGSGSSGSSSSAGSNTSGGSGSSGAGGSSGGGASAAGSQGTLPLTGVNVLAIIALGLLLSGSGLLLHRLRRRGLS
jgi:LPXTG-motif cell wall-anchored protein